MADSRIWAMGGRWASGDGHSEEAAEERPNLTRRAMVGYGYQERKTAREQLWREYKSCGLVEEQFGGGDRTIKRWARVRKEKDCFLAFQLLCPALDWLFSYDLPTAIADGIAGGVMGLVSVPLGFAHSLIAGVSPLVGLWTCFIPTITYAMLGTSRHASQGTDATLALLTHGAVKQYPDSEADQIAQILALMVGCVMFLLGLLRADYVMHYISRPILSGFISGCTVLVFLSQIKYLIGVDYDTSRYGVVNFYRFWENVDDTRLVTSVYSLSILFILVTAVVIKAFMVAGDEPYSFGGPHNVSSSCAEACQRTSGASMCRGVILFLLTLMPIITCALATVITWIIYKSKDDDSWRVAIIDLSDLKLPVPGISGVSASNSNLIAELLPEAALIAIISYISSMSQALTFTRGQYEVSGVGELIALGAASALGSVFGSMPPSTGLTRTAMAVSAGQRTQMTSAISFGVLFVVIGIMDGAFRYMPLCSLACIVCVTSVAMFDWRTPRWLYKIRAKEDLSCWCFAMVVTVVAGTRFGLGASLVLSLVLIIQRISLPGMTALGRNKRDGAESFGPLSNVDHELIPGIIIIHVRDTIFFVNAGRLKDQLVGVVQDAREINQPLHVVILDLSTVNSIDPTALTSLSEASVLMEQFNVSIMLAEVQPEVYMFLQSSGFQRELKQDLHLQASLNDVMETALSAVDTKEKMMREGARAEGGSSHSGRENVNESMRSEPVGVAGVKLDNLAEEEAPDEAHPRGPSEQQPLTPTEPMRSNRFFSDSDSDDDNQSVDVIPRSEARL